MVKPKFVEPLFSHNDFSHQTQLEKNIEPLFFLCQSLITKLNYFKIILGKLVDMGMNKNLK